MLNGVEYCFKKPPSVPKKILLKSSADWTVLQVSSRSSSVELVECPFTSHALLKHILSLAKSSGFSQLIFFHILAVLNIYLGSQIKVT